MGYFHEVGLSLVVFTMVHGKTIEPRYLGPVLFLGIACITRSTKMAQTSVEISVELSKACRSMG